MDRREDNGTVKADELYVATVRWILAGTPQDFLHRRPICAAGEGHEPCEFLMFKLMSLVGFLVELKSPIFP